MPTSTPVDPGDIPVVILAGGQGMRLREETERVPKPMVRIGEQPILWHIMKHFSGFGYRRFIICLGYKSWVVKEYFLNYWEETHDLRITLKTGSATALGDGQVEDWEVTLAETGLDTGSTGRLCAISKYIDAPYFLYTYGDGVGTVDIDALVDRHLTGRRMATVTGVKPSSRYGILSHEGDVVTAFDEKPELADGFISGGFFCLERKVLDHLAPLSPKGFFEIDLLPALVSDGEVGIHQHVGYWHSMDTYRDFVHLNDAWAGGDAPWKTWDD